MKLNKNKAIKCYQIKYILFCNIIFGKLDIVYILKSKIICIF